MYILHRTAHSFTSLSMYVRPVRGLICNNLMGSEKLTLLGIVAGILFHFSIFQLHINLEPFPTISLQISLFSSTDLFNQGTSTSTLPYLTVRRAKGQAM